MKRIKIVALFVCVVILTACNSGKNEYVVNGVVPEGFADGMPVHMSDFNDGLIIDSAKIINGEFSFKGTLDTPKAVRLSLGRLYVNFILEGGTTTVDMSQPLGTKGSPLTDQYNKYMLESENLISEAREKLMNVENVVNKDEPNYDDKVDMLRVDIVNELFAAMDELPLLYFKKNPNDILGAMIFYTWMQGQVEPLTVEKFRDYSGYVGENVLNFGPIKKMIEHYDIVGKTAVGAPFTDFTIENGNLDGSPVSFSDYIGKGKYVLVDFWASWCAPCRMEAPNLAEVYNKYKGDKFELLGVAVWDERQATIRAIEEDGYFWPQILDAQTIPTGLYGIQGIPQIMLFGPDGTIVARDLRGNNLRRKIEEVMQN